MEQHLDTLFPNEKRMLNEKQVSVKDYFSHQIDNAWADVFWHYRDTNTHLFDDRLMHLIRALAIVTRAPDDPDSEGLNKTLEALRNENVLFSFPKYQEHKCIDRPLIETLSRLLDSWCGDSNGIRTYLSDSIYYDEKEAFRRVIRDDKNSTKMPSYSELIQFCAYSAFIREYRDNLEPLEPFGEWMRVIGNLARNTDYDSLDDFKRSLRSIKELLGKSKDILAYLAEKGGEVSGFNGQQIREERLKAQLIRKNDRWKSAILKAERHGYFQGQIEFLLKFSGVLDAWLKNESCTWSESDDVKYLKNFQDYLEKASAVFAEKGLKNFGESRWERALLAIGDYLLHTRCNLSFLDDHGRDTSWKRLLRGSPDVPAAEAKRGYVKALLDRINLETDVKESLNAVIQSVRPNEEWRRLIVESPDVIKYCEGRMIRWKSEQCVYLLKKIRMNGEHRELFSYHLMTGLLSDKYEKGNLAPFAKPNYCPVHTDSSEPYVRLECEYDGKIIDLNISNEGGSYRLKLSEQKSGMLPDKLKAGIRGNPACKDEVLTVDRKRIESTVDEIVRLVSEFAKGTAS